MSSEQQISRTLDEQSEVRQDLHDTLCEFGAKVERAESNLRPGHIVENHPVACALIASLTGFMIGSAFDSRRGGGLIVGAVLGCALLIRSSRGAGGRYGEQPFSADGSDSALVMNS
jgi:hypothetical protein